MPDNDLHTALGTRQCISAEPLYARAFSALHDLSLVIIESEVTPQQIARWARDTVRTVDPTWETAVWWYDNHGVRLLAGEPPGNLVKLSSQVPAHLCLMHHGKLIRPSFFGLEETAWKFVPINDRTTLYGWLGLRLIEDLEPQLLPFLCSVGAMLGQAIRRQRHHEERLAYERREAILSRYLSPAMAQAVMESETIDRYAEQATVLVLDLRGFTQRIFEQDHGQLLGELNLFFEQAVQTIFTHSGVVDKLLGDGMLAEFGILPAEPPNPAIRAYAAARDLLAQTRRFNAVHAPQIPFKIGIGLASGGCMWVTLGGEAFSI